MRWSIVAVGQNLRSISSQAGLQLLNVLVTLTLSHRSFNNDTDHGRVWITLGDWHCGLETFMLGPRFRTHAQSSNTACSTGQSANHLHHRVFPIFSLNLYLIWAKHIGTISNRCEAMWFPQLEESIFLCGFFYQQIMILENGKNIYLIFYFLYKIIWL